jgi:hypothetical protein
VIIIIIIVVDWIAGDYGYWLEWFKFSIFIIEASYISIIVKNWGDFNHNNLVSCGFFEGFCVKFGVDWGCRHNSLNNDIFWVALVNNVDLRNSLVVEGYNFNIVSFDRNDVGGDVVDCYSDTVSFYLFNHVDLDLFWLYASSIDDQVD